MDLDDTDTEQTFTEPFPGCSESHPGGTTFMDLFWQDEYAKQQRENLFFPFASSEEWKFSSWCLCSGLSMASIDSLLSLTIVKRLSLSYRTAKELRARIERLPSGPPWLCKRLQTELPMKQPIRLFYRPPLDCIQSLLSHPLLAPHISFVPRKIWTSAARVCRIYEDWMSGDQAWEIQEVLPQGATVLGVVLSSDKTNISFIHKTSRVRGLLHDRLIHRALNEVLEPLKTAARIGIMMNDPCSPNDYVSFLKVAKKFFLNGVIEPCWVDWPLSCPSWFLHIEPLHHFHRFSWDHDIKWCVEVVTPAEIDFRFSLLQLAVGYRSFEDGISSLKQVTGRNHRVIAGVVPCRFLLAVRALVEFHYRAQAPVFSDQSLSKLTEALKLFHNNKDAVIQANGRKDSWEIPKLELLQSVVSNIRHSGPVMQWSANATKHAHVQEIKNYYDQIARFLDRLDKCFRFDVAMYFEARHKQILTSEKDELDFDQEDDHDTGPNADGPSLDEHMDVSRQPVNYFIVADALSRGLIPNALKPPHTFSSSTTTSHIANKPSLHISVDEAATLFGILDLCAAIWEFLQHMQNSTSHPVSGARAQDLHYPLPFDRLQIWYKLRVQQLLYHDKERVDTPQMLRAYPPSPNCPHGLYDAAILSPGSDSDWPQRGIEGHFVAQLRLLFRPVNADSQYLAAYVQRFNVVPQQGISGNIHLGTGMYSLRQATRSNGTRIGDVVSVSHIRSGAHLIPNFSKEAHARLTRQNSYEISTDFWLNTYWSKESFYALMPT
ncbi:hypothetical protein EV363DRAFT_1399319 [Boletus edulis]|nr:hypothetical protein EV363DRAFT_1399319 [Boletus edulis]